MAEHMPRNKSENGVTSVCEYASIRRKTRTRTGNQDNSGKVLSPSDREKEFKTLFINFSFL